jgi:hypothetical protein
MFIQILRNQVCVNNVGLEMVMVMMKIICHCWRTSFGALQAVGALELHVISSYILSVG